MPTESQLIARYLLGCDPPQELQDRYESACRQLFSADEPEMRFLRRHPWSLPMLDAGAGVLRPESIVRKKVFLMAAILEATPLYADFFLRPVKSLVWQAIRGAFKMAAGIPVFWLARRIG